MTSIEEATFYDCKNLSSLTIPNSVTSIGLAAFGDCGGLSSVTIPNSVTTIGGLSFGGCSGLASITIPNSVTSIGTGAFDNCKSLTDIYYSHSKDEWNAIEGVNTASISANTTMHYNGEIASGICGKDGDNITWELTDDGTLTLSGNGEMGDFSYPDYAPWYSCTKRILNLQISDGITTIGERSFAYCYGITSVVIPNSVTSIGEAAFLKCENLTILTIPNSVTTIGGDAFYGCSLTSVAIPNSVTIIGERAFQSCSSLTSIIIPNSVTSIGSGAFSGCKSLTDIYYSHSKDEWNAIEGVNTASIPANTTIHYNGEIASGICGKDGDNITWVLTDDGTLALNGSGEMKTVNPAPWYFYTSRILKVQISNGITTIGNYAFAECSNPLSITIPNSVTNIGNRAFSGCSGLTSLTIPSSITTIGSSAFYGCSGLTSLAIPNSVTTIGSGAFSNCSGLRTIYAQSLTPPSASSNSFSGVSTNYCILYVPTGAKESYEFSLGWQNFLNIIEEGSGSIVNSKLKGDVNEDGVVDIRDVTELIDILLGK